MLPQALSFFRILFHDAADDLVSWEFNTSANLLMDWEHS